MADAAQTLTEAHSLIELGDLAAARQLLETIRDESQDDPDWWWVYAHAVEDDAEGKAALNRVLELNPNYRGADALAEVVGMRQAAPARPAAPTTLPGMGGDDDFDEFDDFDDFDETGADSGNRRTLLIAFVVIVIVILAALVILPSLSGGTPPATEVAAGNETQQPDITETVDAPMVTEDVTEEPMVTEDVTDEPLVTMAVTEPVDSTDEPLATDTVDATPTSSFSAQAVTTDELATLLGDFNIPDDGINQRETGLGQTLVITTCGTPGPDATNAMLAIADELAAQTLAPDIEGIGFSIQNCDTDTEFILLGMARETLEAYGAGDLSRQELQGSLRPAN